MREFIELRITTNRSVYNKLYKKNLEKSGKIRCSICAFHNGENEDHKWYGTSSFWSDNSQRVRYPSWKLSSKCRKQWMRNPLSIEQCQWTVSRFSADGKTDRNINYIKINL